MAIPFSCPHCHIETLVDDEFVGQSGPCYSCGKNVTVPVPRHLAGKTASAEAALVAESTENAEHLPPVRSTAGETSEKKSSASGTAAILLAVVGGGLLIAVVIVAILISVMVPAMTSVQQTAMLSQCDSNLNQIALAMKEYEVEYGCYPPAYIADANGKPMHSWRVLILPYLDHDWLYEQYHFDEPWDGPHNITLAGEMPDVYACPADADAYLQNETSYMVIAGPGTMFQADKGTKANQITDGASNTMLVIEAPVSGVHWMEPVDFQVRQMALEINAGTGQEIASYHTGGANVALADGTVMYLSDDTPAEEIEAMITINGGEAAIVPQ